MEKESNCRTAGDTFSGLANQVVSKKQLELDKRLTSLKTEREIIEKTGDRTAVFDTTLNFVNELQNIALERKRLAQFGPDLVALLDRYGLGELPIERIDNDNEAAREDLPTLRIDEQHRIISCGNTTKRFSRNKVTQKECAWRTILYLASNAGKKVSLNKIFEDINRTDLKSHNRSSIIYNVLDILAKISNNRKIITRTRDRYTVFLRLNANVEFSEDGQPKILKRNIEKGVSDSGEKQRDTETLLIKEKKLPFKAGSIEMKIMEALAVSSKEKPISRSLLARISYGNKVSFQLAKNRLSSRLNYLRPKLEEHDLSIVSKQSVKKGKTVGRRKPGRPEASYYLVVKTTSVDESGIFYKAVPPVREIITGETSDKNPGEASVLNRIVTAGTIFPKRETIMPKISFVTGGGDNEQDAKRQAQSGETEDTSHEEETMGLDLKMPIAQKAALSSILRGNLYREILTRHGFRRITDFERGELNKAAEQYIHQGIRYTENFIKESFGLLSKYLLAFCVDKDSLLDKNKSDVYARTMLNIIPKGMTPEQMQSCLGELEKSL